MKFGVIIFPGSNCDQDAHWTIQQVARQAVTYLWHESHDLQNCDAIIVPGGFAYGDYLRTGAIAKFSPVMAAVRKFAASGGLVLGICNGFQILLEAGLLPGAMLRNRSLSFICRDVHVRVENSATPFTSRCRPSQVLTLPIAHAEGNYYTDQGTLSKLNANKQVLLRYCTSGGTVTPEANPNGALDNVAGITNAAGNVLGLMPHPERSAEMLLGNEDGRLILLSVLDSIKSGRFSPKPVMAS